MPFSLDSSQGAVSLPLPQPPTDDRPSIAQSGGFSADKNDRLPLKHSTSDYADKIYQSFCEEGGIDSDRLQNLWDAWQDKHGIIEGGDETDLLIQAAMRFAIVNFVEIVEDELAQNSGGAS